MLVGWSRVYLGVHFPLDIAAAGGGVAWLARPVIAAWVLPPIDGLSEAALSTLHLPSALFPRKAASPD